MASPIDNNSIILREIILKSVAGPAQPLDTRVGGAARQGINVPITPPTKTLGEWIWKILSSIGSFISSVIYSIYSCFHPKDHSTPITFEQIENRLEHIITSRSTLRNIPDFSSAESWAKWAQISIELQLLETRSASLQGAGKLQQVDLLRKRITGAQQECERLFELHKATIDVTMKEAQKAALLELESLQTPLRANVISRDQVPHFSTYMTLYSHPRLCPEAEVSEHQKILKLSELLRDSLGFRNLGNTCWLNAGLQMLRSSPEFVALLQREVDYIELTRKNDQENRIVHQKQNAEAPIGTEERISLALNEVLRAVEQGENTTVTSSINRIQMELSTREEFSPRGAQHDASAFVRNCLRAVKYQVNLNFRDFRFGPHGEARPAEPMTIWDVPIPSEVESFAKENTTLPELLEKSKILNFEDGNRREERFSSLPRLLIVTMGRFRSGGGGESSGSQTVSTRTIANLTKVDKAIHFFREIDLSASFLTADLPDDQRLRAKWKLRSFVSHIGKLNGGHFTAYACGHDGKWRHYDDANVTEVTEGRTFEPLNTSYISLYEQITPQEQTN